MRYELDDLTAENGTVLGNLVHNTSPASLSLSPDLADELRRKLKMVDASLQEGMRDTCSHAPRRAHVPVEVITPPASA